jgi:CHAD domain-containing protein
MTGAEPPLPSSQPRRRGRRPSGPSAPLVLAAAIRDNCRDVFAGLSQRGKLSRGRVHRLRVAARRVLVCIELVRTLAIGFDRQTLRALRKLLHALSPLRDVQVQIRALESRSLDGSAILAVRKKLRRKQDKLRSAVARRIEKFDVSALRREVKHVEAALSAASRTSDGSPVIKAVLLGEIGRRCLELDRRWRKVRNDDQRSIHQARLALKKYRYAVEAIRPLLPRSSAGNLRTAKALLDVAGRLHDDEVLIETLHAFEESERGEQRRQLRLVELEIERTMPAMTRTFVSELPRALRSFSKL